MYLDDLPIWGIVGEMEEKEFYIWTHKKFEIGYNGDQIIDVNLTSEGKTKLKLGEEIAFSYEVTWKKSSLKFEVRLMMRCDDDTVIILTQLSGQIWQVPRSKLLPASHSLVLYFQQFHDGYIPGKFWNYLVLWM